jgi:putative membrane protein
MSQDGRVVPDAVLFNCPEQPMQWFLRFAVPIGTALVSPAAAQPGKVPSASAPQVPAQERPVAPLSAAAFLEQLAMVNMFEMEASKLVLERGADEPLMAFARRLLKDNAQLLELLEKEGRLVSRRLDEQHARTLSQLRQSEGVLFEKRYLQEQVRAHQQAIQLYERYGEGGRDEVLKRAAERALPIARARLTTASELSGRFVSHS